MEGEDSVIFDRIKQDPRIINYIVLHMNGFIVDYSNWKESIDSIIAWHQLEGSYNLEEIDKPTT